MYNFDGYIWRRFIQLYTLQIKTLHGKKLLIQLKFIIILGIQ